MSELFDRFGGYWGEHPEHNVEAWQYHVGEGDTRLGYWEWVFLCIEEEQL